MSLPLWECGLKFFKSQLLCLGQLLLRLRECGLKFEKEDDRIFSNYGTAMGTLFKGTLMLAACAGFYLAWWCDVFEKMRIDVYGAMILQ